jgi:hypothetical protein
LPEQGSVFTARSCDVQFTQGELVFSFGGFEFLPHDKFGSKVCDRESDAGNNDRDEEIVHVGHPLAVRQTPIGSDSPLDVQRSPPK